MQVSCISETTVPSCGVRGSPLIRFLFLALALAATAVGLTRVTSARATGDAASPHPAEEKPAIAGKAVPFRLLLSAPASEVIVNDGGAIRPAADESSISGNLALDAQNPRVGVVVHWKNTATSGEHRFAKITLEIPGQPTFSHVFDADGDIDDLLELPLPAYK